MTDRSTQTSRLLSVTPAEVFAAIADPSRLARWWGPDGFTNTFEIFEFVPGGRWVFTMHGPDGTNYANECVFDDLVPNERVVIRHTCLPYFTLTITLAQEANLTRLTWVQEFETAEVLAAVLKIVGTANEQNLNRLEEELARRVS